ncbi:hypothetical protein AMTR_s00019p00195510 [Amborella trichopoda]|uniref:Uncharacterized protein n=1 Tax=Amborella trichopoda TaxID=13333 RepID=W1PBH4_AMBTC|nr:hypothetical protein AMTR_s00019p00195510 [Amborella trichopoda]
MGVPLLLFLFFLSPNPTGYDPLPSPQLSPSPLPSPQLFPPTTSALQLSPNPTTLAPQLSLNLTTLAPQLYLNHTTSAPLFFPELQERNPIVFSPQLPDIMETINPTVVVPDIIKRIIDAFVPQFHNITKNIVGVLDINIWVGLIHSFSNLLPTTFPNLLPTRATIFVPSKPTLFPLIHPEDIGHLNPHFFDMMSFHTTSRIC